MRSRTVRARWATLAGSALVTLASCTGQGHPAATVPGGPVPSGLPATLRGTAAYLLIGPEASANVWLVDPAHPHGKRLTANSQGVGISTLSASPAGLALADARTTIDVVSIYRDHHSRPLPAGHGSVPAISADGTIAYIGVPDVVDQSGPKTWRVELTSDDGGPSRVLYQQPAPDLGAMAWGPRGQLAVISGAGHQQAEVLVLGRTGKVHRRFRPGIGEAGFLAWNAHAPGLAVGGNPGLKLTGTGARGEVITLNGDQTMLPNNWLPMCWSPDGTSLLAARGTVVGLWKPQEPFRITVLGTTGNAGPLSGCAWLSKPAAGT